MGCSPSKGKLFSKPENGSAVENAPLEEPPQPCVQDEPEEKEKIEETVPQPPGKENPSDQDCQVVVDSKNNIKENEMNVMAPEQITKVQETDEVTGTQRRPKNKKKQRSHGKLRKSITKVDFPPHMVRAHLAAYNFLNPNISKFESLLELLEQAAHTQLSLQPMMSALVLRFEEINQALEEMAEEGELMLNEHKDSMALPSGMMGPAVISALKSTSDRDCQSDPPQDLLQQLLRHSTEKMKHVGRSFQTVGDNTLEEAVDYFTSLSKLLDGKMKAKHSAEQRIALILARVEAAAMGKSNPEDSALHSEDSGIGGENDSLTGSDRQRRHRDSAGSGSSASGANVRAPLPSNSTNEHNKEEEEDDDTDEEDDDMHMRKRSNSSPPDPSQPFLNMNRVHTNMQRPQTATVNDLVQSSIRRKPLIGHETNVTVVRRHSIIGVGLNKGQSKTNQVYASQRPKPPSVRRLINSFSNPLPNIETARKTLSDTSADGAHRWTDNREDLDEDNLPPPPPEVLMDNSFQITESITGNDKEYHNNLSAINKKQGLSNRLKTSVELLPNRASIKTKWLNVSSADPIRKDTIVGSEEERQCQGAALDPDSNLYQQARAIIHMRSAAVPLQPPMRRDSADAHQRDASFSLPVIAPPVSRARIPPSCPPVRHRYPSPPMRSQSSTSRPGSPKTITRASDNPVEEIIPSVSFKDARSVFCQNQTNVPHWSGPSVLSKPWGEESRGRLGTRAMDSPHRTQSEHRQTISICSGGTKQVTGH